MKNWGASTRTIINIEDIRYTLSHLKDLSDITSCDFFEMRSNIPLLELSKIYTTFNTLIVVLLDFFTMIKITHLLIWNIFNDAINLDNIMEEKVLKYNIIFRKN